MLQKIRHFLRFLHYYFTAQNKHDVHSPFVFELVTKVINDKKDFPAWKKIETRRMELLKDKNKISVTDFGTAFSGPKIYQRSISETTKYSAKPKKYAQLLYRIGNHYKPQTMLELGTSLGISTMYQAFANPESKLITLEGCIETSKVAEENFQKAGLKNIELISGDFNQSLDIALTKFEKLDYVFFDGNHQKKSTLEYFQKCLVKHNENTIFIFDDINWSTGMKEAWNEIINHPKVTVTVDLFVMGIVFFNPHLTKQNFVIRF